MTTQISNMELIFSLFHSLLSFGLFEANCLSQLHTFNFFNKNLYEKIILKITKKPKDEMFKTLDSS